jgi:2-polyprenyl-6-hydroxyphenyl methylase/3-demethylubiquinone-9 3-methyltransferase
MTERFQFGENWSRFLEVVDDERIAEAERGLTRLLGADAVRGRRFLDVGSGSGLSSLAALRLGAARVHSFDYDAQSVACTAEMKRRYAPVADHWTIERGDILDDAYANALGNWDIVYSWGVLHHTGRMWDAIGAAARVVADGGALFIAIYNDQGRTSRYWTRVKKLYNRNAAGRALVVGAHVPYWIARGAAGDAVRLRNPAARYRSYKRGRGMSLVHDWIDWLGGYPFEVARPEAIIRFLRERGFTLHDLTTTGGLGCNEFVFRKT